MNLEEYVHDDILLSPGGIHNGQIVDCCKNCLRLPPFSIANNFHIGETPPLNFAREVIDITIYHPKLHIIKLSCANGPGTRQKDLIGNTITFPRDIKEIAKKINS